VARTNTEMIHELNASLAALGERVESMRNSIEKLQVELTRTTDSLVETRLKVAVLEQLLAELKESTREAERRRWMVLVAFFGSLLALVNGLVLLFVRR
jgi:chromosome segregation ATPase